MAYLIVKSAVKQSLNDMNVVADFYNILDNGVVELLNDAARCTEASDQKTIQLLGL
jgi:histone H3/H4